MTSAPPTGRAGPRAGQSRPQPAIGRPAWWQLWARRLPWWGELLVAGLFYELYDLVQAATASDYDEARAHGLDIVHAEKWLHIWVEPAANHLASRHLWVAILCGYDYAIAHVLVTGSVLGYLWWRRPQVEVPLRNALVGFSLLALIVYWQFPVAPPRLTVGNLSDTLALHNILGADHVEHSTHLVNLYAAMPSLHVAWAFWCGAAIALTGCTRWRHLGWLYPVWTTFVVVVTANHFLLDAVAGVALAGVPLLWLNARWRRSAGSPEHSTIVPPSPTRPH